MNTTTGTPKRFQNGNGKNQKTKEGQRIHGPNVFPEDMNKVSRTVMSSQQLLQEGFILPNGKAGFRHPTIREYATLMSFPFNFNFLETPAHKKKQIGNAVPQVLL